MTAKRGEGRSMVPEGYRVALRALDAASDPYTADEAELDELSEWWWRPMAGMAACDTKAQAVSSCWKHRDEVVAPVESTLRQLVADLKDVTTHFAVMSDPVSCDASLLLRNILRKVGPPYYQEDEVT